MLDKKMIAEGRKVLLFLDNAPSHPDILQEDLKHIKLEFPSKNTTSRLEPCNAGIIQNFKHIHRKLLIRYILTRINTGNRSALEIIKDVTILKFMLWLIKQFTIALMSFYKNFVPMHQSKNFRNLTITFDFCEFLVNTLSVDWRQELRAECI